MSRLSLRSLFVIWLFVIVSVPSRPASHDPELFEHGPEDAESQARGSDPSRSSTPAGRRGPRHQRPHDERLDAELRPSLIFSVCASLDRQPASTIATVT